MVFFLPAVYAMCKPPPSHPLLIFCWDPKCFLCAGSGSGWLVADGLCVGCRAMCCTLDLCLSGRGLKLFLGGMSNKGIWKRGNGC